MEIAQLRQALDDVFDQAVVYYAYTDYMRDYEVIVYATADPRTGIQPAHLRYLFKYCVEAETRTALRPETWRTSLDERSWPHPDLQRAGGDGAARRLHALRGCRGQVARSGGQVTPA
ncbi:hypothetical protein ACNTMW_34190 [Planosporangium sp. 12N6]|uniref:YxiG-like protein n=1 Tax=Planosporangium spinosum TaxID=3402278 RepID=UPI003CED9196